MRHYDAGRWSVSFIFTLRGSVIPKALAWAIPSSALAVGIHLVAHGHVLFPLPISATLSGTTLDVSQVWAAYNFLLAFLMSFRTGKAYSRWWEGGTLLQQARGEWFNAFSSLIAFCSSDQSRKTEVKNLQRLLATLMSMLFCAALNQISQYENSFEVLDLVPLKDESIGFLRNSSDKVEVILLWIQKLIVESMDAELLPIPAPVLSRAFQELSRGVVNVNNVRKIAEFLFPFPYAQLISSMLLLHCLVTPFVVGILLDKWYWALLSCFVSVFAFWSLNYIAAEIECPFGEDENDLPMRGMQQYMNRTLLLLLEDLAQEVPRSEEQRPSLKLGDSRSKFRRAQSFMGCEKRIFFDDEVSELDDDYGEENDNSSKKTRFGTKTDSGSGLELKRRIMTFRTQKSKSSESAMSSSSSRTPPFKGRKMSTKSNMSMSNIWEEPSNFSESVTARQGEQERRAKTSTGSVRPSLIQAIQPEEAMPPRPPEEELELAAAAAVIATLELSEAAAGKTVSQGAKGGALLSLRIESPPTSPCPSPPNNSEEASKEEAADWSQSADREEVPCEDAVPAPCVQMKSRKLRGTPSQAGRSVASSSLDSTSAGSGGVEFIAQAEHGSI